MGFQAIHDFLYDLYVKASEFTPEVTSDHCQGKPACRPLLQFRKRKGKRPRILKKREPNSGKQLAKPPVLRQLPHGNYVDYLRMFRARHPEIPVTLKLFCKVAECVISDYFYLKRFWYSGLLSSCLKSRQRLTSIVLQFGYWTWVIVRQISGPSPS